MHILNWLSILDWNISRWGGGGVGVWEKRAKKMFPAAKSICESSLRLIRRSSEKSTWSGVPLTLQSNWSVYVYQSMYNSCISSWKRGTTKCKLSAWKAIILEMECKSGCHERKKSSSDQCLWTCEHFICTLRTDHPSKSDLQIICFHTFKYWKLHNWFTFSADVIYLDCFNCTSSMSALQGCDLEMAPYLKSCGNMTWSNGLWILFFSSLTDYLFLCLTVINLLRP